MVGYLGHDPELFNDSVRNNILLGDDDDPEKYLKAVCFDGEVAEMEEGMDTIVGNGGVRLSGGQAQRLALARTLCHKRPVLILDDPFPHWIARRRRGFCQSTEAGSRQYRDPAVPQTLSVP